MTQRFCYRGPKPQKCPKLSGPISRDIAIVSLRYPLSRDTFSAIPAIPQQGAIPPLAALFYTDISVRYPILQHIARYLCDTPGKQARKSFAILSLKVLRDMKSIAAGPQKCPKSLGEGAKGVLDPGAKVSQESFAPPKPCFAPVQLSFAPVQEAFGALGPEDLLHPLLTTLGTFEVSSPCSRTFGSQEGDATKQK